MYKFPKDFKWGVSTASYQIEGGWLEGGKGLSIWDIFAHTPGKILNGDNADITCDHFHRYEEDVKLLKSLGIKAYRLSIAWSRILPTGSGTVNQEGINFYSKLFELLFENEIEPWVTLYHWDLPATLEMEKDGWLNKEITEDFGNYARICFDAFGDKVKNWITINEPWVISLLGYRNGEFAPGRISNTEPYIVGHNLLIAHGKASKIYNDEFKTEQQGQIGLAANCAWFEPKSDSAQDIEASERALQFALAWFIDPIYKGDYPKVMRDIVADRLPQFSDDEIKMIKGSSDFFGLNHYATFYAENKESNNSDGETAFNLDENVLLSSDDSWEKTSMDWSIVPDGFGKLLEWINDRYDQPDIIVTENGAAFEDFVKDGKIKDEKRINYLHVYITEMGKAIDKGVKINGYFVWSLMDNFEWVHGFSKRFGLYYVDYNTLERIQKESARWYKNVISRNEI